MSIPGALCVMTALNGVATQFAFESITPQVEVPMTIVAAALLLLVGADPVGVSVGSGNPGSPQATIVEAKPTSTTVRTC